MIARLTASMIIVLGSAGCTALDFKNSDQLNYTVTDTQTHTMFSAAQPPAIRVPSGSIVEMFTHEATGGQFKLGSDNENLESVDFSRVHTMTGPVYVEGAKPGDVLEVELLHLEVADWGWMALLPQFGIFVDEIDTTHMQYRGSVRYRAQRWKLPCA